MEVSCLTPITATYSALSVVLQMCLVSMLRVALIQKTVGARTGRLEHLAFDDSLIGNAAWAEARRGHGAAKR